MNTDELKELARAALRIIETGDEALAARTIDPGFVNHDAEEAAEDADRRLTGPAGLLAAGSWLRDSFSDLRFQQRETAVDGTSVLAATVMTGRHTGSFQGIPATERAFRQQQVHIFTTVDGLITGHRAVRDDLGLLMQLGWQPAQP